jgi:toxin CcdB
MAKYDVYRRGYGAAYLLDCQADLLDHLNTRFVVPLMTEPDAPRPATRLNPIIQFDGRALVMVTQFAAAMPVPELGKKVGSCLKDQDAIGNALDMLISGF